MHGLLRHTLHKLAVKAYKGSRQGFSKHSSAVTTATAGPLASTAVLTGTRGVLRLSGEDLVPFLQGLITNDANLLKAPGNQILYAALLNAQGRHLHDMFLHKSDGPNSGTIQILADVDKETLPALKRKLLMYKLRSAVDIADVSDEFQVWVNWDQSTEIEAQSNWHKDPRLSELGARAVLREDQALKKSADSTAGQKEFKRLRLSHGVAEGDTEIPHGQAVPLEYNMDALNGISYTKGCYVGQELIARTHHKGVVRKRLIPVTVSGPCELGAGLRVHPSESEIGTLRAIDGDLGLAHVRLKLVMDALGRQQPLQAGEANLVPQVPSWWPKTWGHEE